MVEDVTGWKASDIEHFLELREVPKDVQDKVITAINVYNMKNSTVDGPPCADCGGTQFIRTGTCYVCVNDGTSQGCS